MLVGLVTNAVESAVKRSVVDSGSSGHYIRLVAFVRKRETKTGAISWEPDMTNEHTTKSSLREKIIEHDFVGEALKTLWQRGIRDIEVLKPEVDAGGYDLVMELRGITRHIQLKSSYIGASTRKQKVSLDLAAKQSGCVVWVRFDPDTLKLGPFLWFGGKPGEPLPDISNFPVVKHAKANMQRVKSERPNLRVLTKSRFTALETMDDVLSALFGKLQE